MDQKFVQIVDNYVTYNLYCYQSETFTDGRPYTCLHFVKISDQNLKISAQQEFRHSAKILPFHGFLDSPFSKEPGSRFKSPITR